MTMTAVAMPSSEAASSPSKRAAGGLRGPRPLPLKVSSSSRGSSPPTTTSNKAPPSTTTKKHPVIVYEHTPKVIHARPQEFMTVVQRLTGKPPVAPATSSSSSYMPISPALAEEGGGGDPLLLTLGQRQAAPPATATTTMMPSPMAAGMLMSPGFIFSPNTMQAIQELSPLF